MGQRLNPQDWSYTIISLPEYTIRGYTSHEHLDPFDLINMNGRIFDPEISRFLSPDPIVQDPYNMLNYNRYSYCLNNPLSYNDPSGYSYKAYMNSVYGERNYWYRGQAPGTWSDWESFHYGGGGSYGSELTANDINLLWDSNYGGYWSSSTGKIFYKNKDQAYFATCVYIN